MRRLPPGPTRRRVALLVVLAAASCAFFLAGVSWMVEYYGVARALPLLVAIVVGGTYGQALLLWRRTRANPR